MLIKNSFHYPLFYFIFHLLLDLIFKLFNRKHMNENLIYMEVKAELSSFYVAPLLSSIFSFILWLTKHNL